MKGHIFNFFANKVIRGSYKGMVLIIGMGVGVSEIPYNSRESPCLRKRFFMCPFISPKDSENIDGLKFFAPL